MSYWISAVNNPKKKFNSRELRDMSGNFATLINILHQTGGRFIKKYTKTVIAGDMTGKDLSHIDFGGASFDRYFLMDYTNFTGSNFFSSEFASSACFYEKDIIGTNFTSANLPYSHFSYSTTLRNVNFSNANLRNADFSESTLDGVNFSDADLTGAKFKDAIINDINLFGAILDNITPEHVKIKLEKIKLKQETEDKEIHGDDVYEIRNRLENLDIFSKPSSKRMKRMYGTSRKARKNKKRKTRKTRKTRSQKVRKSNKQY
jgi:uncharacterized protein YjbI with pentapeptide repeats